MIMNQAYNVSSAPKTTTFQMRMNPEIKQRAEQLYASYGLNLTDAINIFIQQSLNVEGCRSCFRRKTRNICRPRRSSA